MMLEVPMFVLSVTVDIAQGCKDSNKKYNDT